MIRNATLMLAASTLLAGCTAHMQAAPAVAPASPEAIRGVNHVMITVSDIDDTLAFYAPVVPYEVVERSMLNARDLPAEILSKREGQIETALIRTPTVFLRLYDIEPGVDAAPDRRPVEGPGYTHICFQTVSSNSGYDRFKKHGLDVLSRGDGPVDLGGYGVTYAYGFDPDGIMIEMEQLAPNVIAAGGAFHAHRSKNSAWISHLANVPGDKSAMVDFYTTILGYGPRRDLPPTRRKTFDDVVNIDDIEIEASWFDTGNLELEFWHYNIPATPLAFTPHTLDEIGYGGPVFEVTDLAGTVARLERQGIKFLAQSFDLQGWQIRYARDPEGNLLAFQQRTTAPSSHSIETMRDIAKYRGIAKAD